MSQGRGAQGVRGQDNIGSTEGAGSKNFGVDGVLRRGKLRVVLMMVVVGACLAGINSSKRTPARRRMIEVRMDNRLPVAAQTWS